MSNPDLQDRDAYLSWVEVDIDSIRHNFRILKALTRQPTHVFAVVKADAYGHGDIPVARAMVREGADRLCVARVEEAVALRRGGIAAPLLVFAPPMESQARLAIGLEAAVTVCHGTHIEAVAAAARALDRQASVHIKVDIGMGRLGVAPQDALEFARAVARQPELRLDGVMSHFPCADTKPRVTTLQEISLFAGIRETLVSGGLSVPCYHCANSAALIDFPESHFDAVRPGISLYGQYPSSEMERRVPLVAAMSLKSTVVLVKDVPAGQGLSYGHAFVTRRPSRIATVPLGYADGYPRHASNLTRMLLRGQLAPLVGRVCMDLVLLDVTDIPGVGIGDGVTAFGTDGTRLLAADAIAAAAGTIGYEMTTRIGKRLPRFYSG